jgi:uncharacterized membrane protein
MSGRDIRRPTPTTRDADSRGWAGTVLGAALVIMALVAGLNFTFSVAVMPNLAGVDDETFVLITQRFNANPVFPISFTIALLLPALAAFMLRTSGSRRALRWTIVALLLYGVVLGITAGVHIPLNLQIDQAGDPGRIEDLAHVRNQFEDPWVVGNIVRTLFCTAAVAALGRSLLLQGRHQGTAG